MTMASRTFIGITAVILSCLCTTAQAAKHLTSDERKILAASSVAVVYIDSDRALWPYVKQNSGITPLSMAIADELNQRELDHFNALYQPHAEVIGKLGLPASDRQAVQEALSSVGILQQKPWMVVVPDPRDHSFLLEQSLKTKADIVIFIRPRLEMNDDGDDFYLVTLVDMETIDTTGKTFNHYLGTEISADVDVDDDALPPVRDSPAPGSSEDDIRVDKLFQADGAAFKQQVYAKLLQQAQQQLYYFFTGENDPPPAASAVPAAKSENNRK